MAKTKAELAAELDAIVAELGDPVEVRTKGPKTPAGGAQDVLDVAAYFGVLHKGVDTTVRTKRKAIEWGRDQARDATQRWSGMCLSFVRQCFNVPPLYPDAITAWDESESKHREPDTGKWPRGHAGFYRVGDHGHTVLTLGDDRCLSNDADPDEPQGISYTHASGFQRAWGAVPLGYTDDVNAEPAPAPRSRQQQPGIEWRRRYLHRALVRARSAGQTRRAARIRAWLDQMRRRG